MAGSGARLLGLVVAATLALLVVVVGVAATLPSDTRFFFPSECQANANTTRVCCPSFGSEQCGGDARGSCVELTAGTTPMCNGTRPYSMFWVSDYFDYACSCNGNYAGVGCEHCAPGWSGDDCSVALPLRVRQDIESISDDERQRYVQGVTLLAQTDHPYWPGELSMWGYLGAMHAWAKDPMLNSNSESLDHVLGVRTDFAHDGPALLSWHRAFQYEFERLMTIVLDDVTYAVPYWNWTRSTAGNPLTDTAIALTGGDGNPLASGGFNCTVFNGDRTQQQCNCTLTTGPFANFTTTTYWNEVTTAYITRSLGCYTTDESLSLPLSHTLVDTALSYPNWNIMTTEFGELHGKPHQYVGYTLRTGGPPSDPIFFLHHSYVDLLVELWMREAMDNGTFTFDNIQPASGTLNGHQRDECMIPMVPLSRNMDWMVPSWSLGVTYDYLLETRSETEPAVTQLYVLPGAEAYYTSRSSSISSITTTSALRVPSPPSSSSSSKAVTSGHRKRALKRRLAKRSLLPL